MNNNLINKYNINRFLYHFKNGNFKHILKKMREKIFFNNRIDELDINIINDNENYEKLVFNKNTYIEVSIIVPVYNQFDYTYKCLKAIKENTIFQNYEIILADDNSTDEKIKNIKRYINNIKVIRNKKNLGFLENCNNAARYAKGKYILFLNNDTQVQKYWLESLLKLIKSDKKVGLVGSKLVYPDGRQQEAGGIIWKDASGWNFGRLDDPNKSEYNYVKEVDYISGASIMIRKDLWEKIGGFDIRYKPAYFEDSDLAFEVRKHGYKVMFQPKSVVVHFEGVSHGTDVSSGIKNYQIKNREKFINKWKYVLEKEHFENAQHVFLARDRSRFKKHILFIDHYIPHFDQDAGSRTVYQYIKFFMKNNFQVHFIGDNFWHYPGTPYLDALEQLGVEVLWGPYYANHWKDWLKENGRYIDYVFLNRPHISIKYIDEVKKYTNAKIIYYGHDLHFLRLQREYEVTKSKKVLEEMEYFKNLEMTLMKKSNVVLYPSYLEKEAIKKIDENINVLDVPAYLYENFSKEDKNIKMTSDLMFVGGFSHGPNTDAVKWFVDEIFPIVRKSIPEIKFYVIGSNPPEEIQKLHNGKDIIVTGYVSDEELNEFYRKCRISVVPLRYGGGVKGKVVEALYYNMPIVTTSTGAEGLNGVEEYLIVRDDAKAFADIIIELYNNFDMLKRYSKGREYCEKYFSDKTIKKIFSEFIDFGDKK